MNIRYYVEHIALPSLLKENPKELVALLGQGKEKLIMQLYKSASETLNQPNDYKEEEFKVDLIKYQEKYFFQIMRMPDRNIEPPFCHYEIISLDENQANPRLFTIEATKNDLLFCEWKNDRHYAYGKFSPEEDPLKRIVDIREQEKNK